MVLITPNLCSSVSQRVGTCLCLGFLVNFITEASIFLSAHNNSNLFSLVFIHRVNVFVKLQQIFLQSQRYFEVNKRKLNTYLPTWLTVSFTCEHFPFWFPKLNSIYMLLPYFPLSSKAAKGWWQTWRWGLLSRNIKW